MAFNAIIACLIWYGYLIFIIWSFKSWNSRHPLWNEKIFSFRNVWKRWIKPGIRSISNVLVVKFSSVELLLTESQVEYLPELHRRFFEDLWWVDMAVFRIAIVLGTVSWSIWRCFYTVSVSVLLWIEPHIYYRFAHENGYKMRSWTLFFYLLD